MKICTCCNINKDLDCYFNNKKSKDGLTYWCKNCCNNKQNEWRSKNKKKRNQSELNYYYRNKEKIRSKAREKYIPNNTRIRTKEKTAASKRKWKQNNKHLVRADAAMRRAIVLNACPVWADLDKIKEIYKEAQRRRKNGENVHVDHIIPLRGKTVCGFHIAENLQIIPASENLKKRNKLIELK